jgi:TonB family protein
MDQSWYLKWTSFSVLIHIGLVALVRLLPSSPSHLGFFSFQSINRNTPVEVTIRKYSVEQPLLPDQRPERAPDIKDPLVFSARDKVRVKEMTAAKLWGLTKNRSKKTLDSEKNLLTTRQPKNKNDFTNIQTQMRREFLEKGESTFSEFLPVALRVSDISILNTDPGLYYSFFSRLKEGLQPRWQENLDKADTPQNSETILSSGLPKIVTIVDVVLFPDGKLHSLNLMKSSGYEFIDQTSLLALRDMQLFPNPPKGMVSEDGMIRIKLAFGLNLRAASY